MKVHTILTLALLVCMCTSTQALAQATSAPKDNVPAATIRVENHAQGKPTTTQEMPAEMDCDGMYAKMKEACAKVTSKTPECGKINNYYEQCKTIKTGLKSCMDEFIPKLKTVCAKDAKAPDCLKLQDGMKVCVQAKIPPSE